jgi:hypothetical protein
MRLRFASSEKRTEILRDNVTGRENFVIKVLFVSKSKRSPDVPQNTPAFRWAGHHREAAGAMPSRMI